MMNRWLAVAFLALTVFGAVFLASGCDDDVIVNEDMTVVPDLSEKG